jgi:hypothetical protein
VAAPYISNYDPSLPVAEMKRNLDGMLSFLRRMRMHLKKVSIIRNQMPKGLRQQIEDGDNIVTYKPMSNDDFSNAMDEIFVKPAARGNLKGMLEKEQVTQTEYDNLLKMINSPDNENLTLAQMLIELKKPTQDVNSIHSRKS